jgi:Cys-tRNA(Pro)/Cys-tRNA(Cys) deacylase
MSDKTLAMLALDKQNIAYQVIEFPEEIHDAQGVAEFANLPPEEVYKTLVVQRTSPGGRPMLIMVGGDRELNLKKVARAVGEKKVCMAKHVEAERLTGLKVGGISPLPPTNQHFDVYIDRPAASKSRVVVSAGRRGLDLLLAVPDLIRVTGAQVMDATDEPEG